MAAVNATGVDRGGGGWAAGGRDGGCIPGCIPCSSLSLDPLHPPLAQILGKLTSLPFQQCKHHIDSLDAQPSLSSGVLVFVTGRLLVS